MSVTFDLLTVVKEGNLMDADDYLTAEEAALVVRQKVGTLAQWRYLGTGPRYYKAGRKPLYRRSELLTWLEEQARTSTREHVS